MLIYLIAFSFSACYTIGKCIWSEYHSCMLTCLAINVLVKKIYKTNSIIYNLYVYTYVSIWSEKHSYFVFVFVAYLSIRVLVKQI